jgi:hypothetical protein
VAPAGKSRGGIEIEGGVITLERRKREPARSWQGRSLRVVSIILKVLGAAAAGSGTGDWLDRPHDVVIWNTDRTRILYRRGPFGTLGACESEIASIEAEVDRIGFQNFLHGNGLSN